MNYKKIIGVITVTTLMLTNIMISVSAKDESIYTTDITGFIDGFQIPVYVSYNGYPYIIAEDLQGYGFDIQWKAIDDTLYIEYNPSKTLVPYDSVDFNASKNNKVADLYSCNTKVLLDGIKIPAYSINGHMLISMDDLWRYGHVNWYEDAKSISFTSRNFEENNKDWETLMPAMTMYDNIIRVVAFADKIYCYIIDDVVMYSYEGSQKTIKLDESYEKKLNSAYTYIEERLTKISNNNLLYNNDEFYHLAYNALTYVEVLKHEYNMADNQSVSYFLNNRMNDDDLALYFNDYEKYADSVCSSVYDYIDFSLKRGNSLWRYDV